MTKDYSEDCSDVCAELLEIRNEIKNLRAEVSEERKKQKARSQSENPVVKNFFRSISSPQAIKAGMIVPPGSVTTSQGFNTGTKEKGGLTFTTPALPAAKKQSKYASRPVSTVCVNVDGIGYSSSSDSSNYSNKE